MNQDNMSTALWYLWIMCMWALGAFNLRGIIKNIQERKKMIEEIEAKNIKISLLETKLIVLETLHHDNAPDRNSK